MRIEDIRFNDFEPKYVQLCEYLKKMINKNIIHDGEKLPTIRNLSAIISVNKSTVVNAYKKLEYEGYAVSKMGSGTYAKRRDLIRVFKKQYRGTLKSIDMDKSNDVIDFTGETTSESLFPIKDFKSIINEVLDRDGAEALIYQDPLGYERLRSTISKKYWDSSINSSEILIVSGAQQGIDLAARTILNANDYVVVEKPTYGGALSVFKSMKAEILEIDSLIDGPDLDAFEKHLKKHKVKIFYTMSYFQYPSGVTISQEKKKRLIELAEEYDFYIVEDDYLSELIYDDSIDYVPMKKLDYCDRVIYIKSFSKIFLPGIRLGYMIVPIKIRDSLQLAKINTDIATSSLMQHVLQVYIEKNYWEKRSRSLTDIYKERYNCMIDCINDILGDKVKFIKPGGGLHIFLKLKRKRTNSIRLYNDLKKEHVLITPGVMFFNNGNDGLGYFRISFSEVNCEEIRKGIEVINKYI